MWNVQLWNRLLPGSSWDSQSLKRTKSRSLSIFLSFTCCDTFSVFTKIDMGSLKSVYGGNSNIQWAINQYSLEIFCILSNDRTSHLTIIKWLRKWTLYRRDTFNHENLLTHKRIIQWTNKNGCVSRCPCVGPSYVSSNDTTQPWRLGWWKQVKDGIQKGLGHVVI